MEEKIIRYRIYDDNGDIIADEITSFEEAKEIAKENNASEVTKYTWNNEADYDEYKPADDVKEFRI